MIQVQVDGSPMHADFGGVRTMGDLLELVKASIDPDYIITAVELEGKVLKDNEWSMPLSAQTDRQLQILTGSRQAFVKQRLETSVDILGQIVAEFTDAGNSYRKGFSPEGNTGLARAVDDLGAFVTWYDSLLTMGHGPIQQAQVEFRGQVNELQKVCEQIIQQQLYNSWWALAETISSRLAPQLEEIKVLCGKISQIA